MILLLVFFPFLMASVLALTAAVCKPEKRGERTELIAVLTTGLEFLPALLYTLSGNASTLSLEGAAGLGLHLETDGFRRVYTVIISFMWFMTMLLSKEYFRGHGKTERYFFFNLMTLGAIQGVFLSADLFTALVFFEIMSFTSFPWVIQEETEGAVKAANTYLAVAVIGGLAALMGLFLLNQELGTLTLSELPEKAAACSDRKVLYTAGACILFGFGAKAGMFPLHIWLPKAHPVAPAPASALLSGVLTKSGIWGILAVSSRIFGGDPAWGAVILSLGTVTMLSGAVSAVFSIDLKKTLACSSMSQIGFILIGIGMMGILGTENALAARGAFLHMVNHSLFKLVLFMCAGIVYMNCHALDLNEIRGFGKGKTLLHAAFLLGAAGIAGVPGLNGYISKTLLHESIVEGENLLTSLNFSAANILLKAVEWIFLFSGGLTAAYMTKLYVCLFWEKPTKEFHGHKPYVGLPGGVAVAVSAVLFPVLGLGAKVLMNRLADFGTDFFLASEMEETVRYFSLENLKGAGISLGIGALVYFFFIRKVLIREGRYVNLWPEKLDLEDGFYRPLLLRWLPAFFGGISRIFADNVVTSKLCNRVLHLGEHIALLFSDNVITARTYHGAVRTTGILARVFHDMLDGLILLLRKTVFRESRIPDTDKVHNSIYYQLGLLADRRLIRRGKESPGGHEMAHRIYRRHLSIREGTHQMTDTLSFALLMLCIALCAVFVYVLLIKG